MNHLKNFTMPIPPQEDRMTLLLQSIQAKCLELDFLKLITSFILTGKESGDRDLLFYNLLTSRAQKRKDIEPLFSHVISELVSLLLFQERLGFAFYYACIVPHPNHQLSEMKKGMKARIISELYKNDTGKKLNCLVVDDCPASLKLIEKKFFAYKQSLTSFSDPLEAILHLKETKTKYDLIICDYNIPGTNGIDFLNSTKEIEHLKDCFLVLYSALLPTEIPPGIYGISKTNIEAIAGLIHGILVGKEPD